MDYASFKNLNHNLYIVSTYDDNGNKVGFVGNTAMVIKNKPMTIALSVNHNSYSNSSLKKSKRFSISVLSQKNSLDIILKFGFSSSEHCDKFKDFKTNNINGLEIIQDSYSYILCDVIDILEAPTHSIFLAKVYDAKLNPNNTAEPMTYDYYKNVLKGKDPEKSPSY